jgi:prevent-host-death family protein
MKRMSASDAKNRWGDLIRTVTDEGETVVVESRREPLVVVISPSEYDEFQALRRAKLLRDVRESFNRIQETQREMTRNLSDDDADALIEEVMAEDRSRHSRFPSGTAPS